MIRTSKRFLLNVPMRRHLSLNRISGLQNLVPSLPEDIWKIIIRYFFEKENAKVNYTKESISRRCFQKLCCVSRFWSKMIHNFVVEWFKDDCKFSNWVLGHFPDLLTLDLERENIEDKGLEKLTNLTSLNLAHNSRITNAALTKLSNLKSLNLCTNIKITNEALKKLPNLTHLDLTYNEVISNAGILHLTTSLSILNLNANISGYCLTSFTNLTDLSLQRNWAIDEDLLKLSKLKRLSLSYTNISDNCLMSLTQLTGLQLRSNSFLTSECLKPLRNLSFLALHETYFSRLDMSNLTNLTELSISDCLILRNNDLMHLTKLKILDLGLGTLISNEGINYLTQLNQLKISTCNIGNEGIMNLTNLTSLVIYQNPNITHYGLQKLTNLLKLDVRGRSKINPNITSLLTRLNYFCLDDRDGLSKILINFER